MNWFGFIIGVGGACIVIQLFFWYMALRWERRKHEVLAFMKTLPQINMDCKMPPPTQEMPERKMFM